MKLLKSNAGLMMAELIIAGVIALIAGLGVLSISSTIGKLRVNDKHLREMALLSDNFKASIGRDLRAYFVSLSGTTPTACSVSTLPFGQSALGSLKSYGVKFEPLTKQVYDNLPTTMLSAAVRDAITKVHSSAVNSSDPNPSFTRASRCSDLAYLTSDAQLAPLIGNELNQAFCRCANMKTIYQTLESIPTTIPTQRSLYVCMKLSSTLNQPTEGPLGSTLGEAPSLLESRNGFFDPSIDSTIQCSDIKGGTPKGSLTRLDYRLFWSNPKKPNDVPLKLVGSFVME